MRGKVKWYNLEKGYGFIVPDEGGSDVFVHFSTLRRTNIKTLEDGQPVTFEPEPGREGKPKAVKVELVL